MTERVLSTYPGHLLNTDCEKFVMTLITFEPVDVSNIPFCAPKKQEKKEQTRLVKTIVLLD
jgi:hypothetical protein